jgi:hypothetical protein
MSRLIGLIALVAALMMGTPAPEAALSATSGAAWEISSVAQPTNFSSADNVNCERVSLPLCDRYIVTITNVGAAPTNGQSLTISDLVLQDGEAATGLEPVSLSGRNLEVDPRLESHGFGWDCSLATTTCTYEGTVGSGGTLVVDLELKVKTPGLRGTLTNLVSVAGGGAPRATTTEQQMMSIVQPNSLEGGPSVFGIAAYGMTAHIENGASDAQALDHPFGLTTTVGFNTAIEFPVGGAPSPASVTPPRDVAVYLPLGLVGDPTAAARCTNVQLIASGGAETECPSSSRIGSVLLLFTREVTGSVQPPFSGGAVSALYNMVPERGYPAELGFKAVTKPVMLYANVVHMGSGYALRIAVPGIPTTIGVNGVAVTLFGDPRAADGESNSSQAFFTNPGNCSAGHLTAKVEADSWAAPAQWVTAETVAYPSITGCDLLRFEPELEFRSETTQAEEPAGEEIKIKLPQALDRFPVLASPEMKNVTMTLPAGMTVSPGAGDGLAGCDATGPHGIDMPSGDRTPTETGEGEEIGADGMSRLVAGHCPPSSQIGTVEISTPVLPQPLEGRLYVAQPSCGGPGQALCTTADATNGNLFGLYLEAEGSGVVVKLQGSLSVNPATGQLTAKFLENPQLPVSEVVLHVKGGGRAPLANPRQCGEALAYADLTPWSSPVTPDAFVAAGFPIDWDGNGSVCPAVLPFAPTLEAGATSPQADHFGAFTLTVARGDRQQDLARVQVKMPVGLLGMLSKVPLCEEPQAAQGACSEASRIGTTSAAAGSGPQPLWVQGRVYLTGPYAGAPFGLSIVVPAVAGPFNLGNVVVRSRIDVDPNTTQLTVTSDPLPQFRDGVPLRIQKLNVAIDLEGFIFNPTSCTAKQIEATLEAQQGASSKLTTPFAVEGCKGLPFKPTFKVSSQAKTSKAKGASLDVTVTSGAGQANIKSVAVSLPKQLPARLTTIQKACPEATFAQNPATCPPQSAVGVVKAVTPVLNLPLTGPAYLVSHGGAAFPDLVVILQGQGVRFNLTGGINISKQGITSSTFASVPDAPITSFELKLPEGPHSALAATLPAKANGSLCGTKLTMPTTITGQNNAQIKQSTKITVTGCPKVKKAKKAKAKTKK